MAKQVRGSLVRLIGVSDATFGAPPVTPSTLILPFVQNNVKADQTRDQDQTISGFRGMVRSVAGARKVAGALQINAAPQTIGFWLKHLLGAPTSTTVAGVTTYVFTPAASGANALPPSFTLEEDMGAGLTAASRYMRYLGCRIASAAISIGASGFMQFNPTISGADFVAGATALDAAPTDTGHAAFSTLTAALVFGGGTVTLDSTKLSLAINNNLDTSGYVVGGNGRLGDLPEGLIAVTGSIETLLKDDSLLQLALTDADTSLVLTLQNGTGAGTAGNEQLVIDIPALVFASTSPTVPGPKGLLLTGTFDSHRTSGETGVTFTLKTPLATIQ
jgi:hypothetical protein